MGLNLPLVLSQVPVVSLNTLGTRRVKTLAEQRRDKLGEKDDVLHESRLDRFDRRLASVNRQFAKKTAKSPHDIYRVIKHCLAARPRIFSPLESKEP